MVKNYIIGLIGLTGSGKTSFIATSIHELVAGAVGSALDIQLSPASEYVEQKYQNDYYKVVYNNIPPAGTVPAQGYDPLIYTLKRHGQPDVNLIFYDVAGEDLAGPSAVARYGRFVFYAHAFIALEDPLSIDAISQHVVPNERLKDDTFEQVNGKDVLTWVIDLYQRYQNGRKTIRIPTAITLSKSDVLKYAQQRARYTFFTEPPYQDKIHTPRLTQRDFMNVDGDVQSFLRGVENSEGLRLLGWKRQFKNAHYFAISATGRPVNIAAGVAPDIEPRRVLDPLLWVLWQLNIVPAQ